MRRSETLPIRGYLFVMLLLRNCGWRKKLVSSLEEKFSTDETCWVIIVNKFEISVNACYATYHVFNC